MNLINKILKKGPAQNAQASKQIQTLVDSKALNKKYESALDHHNFLARSLKIDELEQLPLEDYMTITQNYFDKKEKTMGELKDRDKITQGKNK